MTPSKPSTKTKARAWKLAAKTLAYEVRFGRKCTRPDKREYDRLCFCPVPGRGYGVRQVLARPFINGWVNEMWMREAHKIAANESASEEALWALLWRIEEAANDAYGMWRQTC